MADGPVRVLQLVAGLDIGHAAGGAELFALRLAQLLDPAACRAGVFVFWRYGTSVEAEWLAQLAAAGLPVFGLVTPTGNLAVDLARVACALWQTVDSLRPQVINSHSERGDLLNLALKMLHPTHPQAVQTVHIDRQWSTQPAAGLLFNHFLAPLLFDQQIAVSGTIEAMLAARPLAQWLTKWRGNRIMRLYNGIDAARLAASLTPSASIPPSTPTPTAEIRRARIGIIGRLTEQKGHRDRLTALAWVRLILPVELWILGDGPLAGALQAQTRTLGLQDQVSFLGQRKDVAAILPTLDLCVSASLWEGFPTVLLEAMAAGVPVVATDVSGSRELVQTGYTGLLVPPQQPLQLAAAIVTLLNNPRAAAQMAQQAHRTIQPYTMQATAQAYQTLYQQLAAKTQA